MLALCGGNYQTDAGATAEIPLARSAQYAERAIDLAREIGWRPGEAFAQHVLAMVNATQGHYDRAFDLVRRSLALSEEIGHRQWIIAGTCGLGVLYLELLDGPTSRRIWSRRSLTRARWDRVCGC